MCACHLCEYVYTCVTVVQPVEYIRITGDRKHHQSIGLETSTKAIPWLESISTSSRSLNFESISVLDNH